MHRLRMFGLCLLAALAVVPDSAAQAPAKTRSTARAPFPRLSPPRLLPGTTDSAFATIQGNALDSSSSAVSEGLVRLRDARLGRILESQTTDKSGLFLFRSVDPGTYVVEMVGADQNVLAASQLLNAEAGEVVSAVVKMPFQISSFGGLLGHTVLQATAVAAAAAGSGVMVSSVTGVDASAR